jgi:hypothetical protein
VIGLIIEDIIRRNMGAADIGAYSLGTDIASA